MFSAFRTILHWFSAHREFGFCMFAEGFVEAGSFYQLSFPLSANIWDKAPFYLTMWCRFMVATRAIVDLRHLILQWSITIIWPPRIEIQWGRPLRLCCRNNFCVLSCDDKDPPPGSWSSLWIREVMFASPPKTLVIVWQRIGCVPLNVPWRILQAPFISPPVKAATFSRSCVGVAGVWLCRLSPPPPSWHCRWYLFKSPCRQFARL